LKLFYHTIIASVNIPFNDLKKGSEYHYRFDNRLFFFV